MPALILVVLILTCIACSAEAPAIRAGNASLGPWQRTGEADWRLTEQGVEAGPGENAGFLVSPRRHGDFTLSVEFRIEDDTNSGVFIRCRDRTTITPFDCYEINIWDNHPNQDFRTGSVVTRQAPLARVDTLNRWNRMRIDARGSRVTVTVNDVVTARLEDDSLAEGFIALQYAGKNALEFRNIRFE
jgi:hypothetical protein